MKKTYYVVGTILAVLGLIIAFENILFRYSIWILFYNYTGSLFVPFMIACVIGFGSGWCFAAGRSSRSSEKMADYDV